MLHSPLLLAALVALLWLLGWFFAGVYGIIWAMLLGIIPLSRASASSGEATASPAAVLADCGTDL